MPGEPLVHNLPSELLSTIISHLDAPSAVCLALTSHALLTAVLAATRAPDLKTICPEDDLTPSSSPSAQADSLGLVPHIYPSDSLRAFHEVDKNLYQTALRLDLLATAAERRHFTSLAFLSLAERLRGWMARAGWVFCKRTDRNERSVFVRREPGHRCASCDAERMVLQHWERLGRETWGAER